MGTRLIYYDGEQPPRVAPRRNAVEDDA